MQELYKKDLHDLDNHDGVITHREQDILECEVKWALESITTKKASGGHRIPAELFQILKDDTVKVLHLICQQIWKTQQVATGLEKVSFHSDSKERQCQRMLKLPHNCIHLTCYNAENSPSQASTLYMSCELPYVQAGFRKGRGIREQHANISGSQEKKEISRKHLLLLYWLHQSL